PPPPAHPTSAFPPTSVYPPAAGYPAGYPPPPGKAAGPGMAGPAGGRSGGALLWILIAVFAVLLCGGAGVAGLLAFRNASDDTASPNTPATAAPAPPAEPTTDPTADPTETPAAGAGVVTYEVTGDGPATISYLRVGNRGTERVPNATLPWREELKTDQESFVVSVVATRSGPDRGDLSCRVLLDGKELVKRSSTGTFATVACIHLVVN
ncbi:MAG TPA: MmpS family transport accessory protein, partial [Pilimelia sp.]|nr:MmpS family transport accessory protein [Pilimelia sp.]